MIELFSNGGATQVSNIFKISDATNGFGGVSCVYVNGLDTGSVTIEGALMGNDIVPSDSDFVELSGGTINKNILEIMVAKPTHIRARISADAPVNGVIIRIN